MSQHSDTEEQPATGSGPEALDSPDLGSSAVFETFVVEWQMSPAFPDHRPAA